MKCNQDVKIRIRERLVHEKSTLSDMAVALRDGLSFQICLVQSFKEYN